MILSYIVQAFVLICIVHQLDLIAVSECLTGKLLGLKPVFGDTVDWSDLTLTLAI